MENCALQSDYKSNYHARRLKWVLECKHWENGSGTLVSRHKPRWECNKLALRAVEMLNVH